MRSIIAGVLLFLYLTIFSLPAFLVLFLWRHFQPLAADRAACAIVRGALRLGEFVCGIHVTVRGQEKVPTDRPVLFVSNHRSYFDIVVTHPLTPGICGFVAKKQLERIPSLRVWMRLIHCHFLDRDNLREGMKVIKACAEDIKENGVSLWICPEGTRNHGEEMLPFKEGSFKIAELAGCPVVPVAMTRTDDIFENHAPWIHRTYVTVEFADPIETADLDRAGKKALPGRVQETIAQMYRSNLDI